jgi:hypothetical protein
MAAMLLFAAVARAEKPSAKVDPRGFTGTVTFTLAPDGTLTMEQLDALRESGALSREQLLAVAAMVEALVKSGMVTTTEKAEADDLARRVVTGEKK